ncbi:p450 domain containing protein, partial [Asbolus verrucosus]
MLWMLIVIALIAIGYLMLIRRYRYWIKRGVKQGNPALIFGDNWGTIKQKQSFADMVQMVYNISPNSRYCGMYQFLKPTLILRDPDLIKQITVKDFAHFLNHQNLIPEDADPLWSKNLFSLNNQKWRDMRSTLSPVFTSNKMKYMFSLISQSGEQFAEHFLKQNKEIITVEMKDTFTRFTNDVIANTAFGIKCDSLGERNNEFYLMGKEATDFTGYFIIPQLFKFCDVTFFPKSVSNFFIQLVKENIESREKHGIIRPDMINLLLEARKSGFKNEESQPIQDT